jgi:acyl-CoA dehydrogenase
MQIYNEEHEIFRDTFRKFVAKEVTPFVPQWEEDRAVPA